MNLPARLFLPADPAATERLGEQLGERLRPGDAVALVGEMGAGKTTLVRGLARGLRVLDAAAVQSPTYLLVLEYEGPVRLLHADAYLPQKLAGFLADGGLEYLFDPTAVAVVEWAEHIREHLPRRTLWVELALAPSGGRQVTLRSDQANGFPWVAELSKMA